MCEETNDIIECKKRKHAIYLLLLEEGEKYHYVYIKNIGRLLNLQKLR